MATPKKLKAAALAPPANKDARTIQEKAQRAIAIRESTAKARKGKPMTFPERRMAD